MSPPRRRPNVNTLPKTKEDYIKEVKGYAILVLMNAVLVTLIIMLIIYKTPDEPFPVIFIACGLCFILFAFFVHLILSLTKLIKVSFFPSPTNEPAQEEEEEEVELMEFSRLAELRYAARSDIMHEVPLRQERDSPEDNAGRGSSESVTSYYSNPEIFLALLRKPKKADPRRTLSASNLKPAVRAGSDGRSELVSDPSTPGVEVETLPKSSTDESATPGDSVGSSETQHVAQISLSGGNVTFAATSTHQLAETGYTIVEIHPQRAITAGTSNIGTMLSEDLDCGIKQSGDASDLSTPEDEVKTVPKSSTDEGMSSGESLESTPVSLPGDNVTFTQQTSSQPEASGTIAEIHPQIAKTPGVSNIGTMLPEDLDCGIKQSGDASDLSTPEDEVKTLPKSSTDEGMSSGDSTKLSAISPVDPSEGDAASPEDQSSQLPDTGVEICETASLQSSTSEGVSSLESLGYIETQDDPSGGCVTSSLFPSTQLPDARCNICGAMGLRASEDNATATDVQPLLSHCMCGTPQAATMPQKGSDDSSDGNKQQSQVAIKIEQSEDSSGSTC